jgi:hypothetical protein
VQVDRSSAVAVPQIEKNGISTATTRAIKLS